MCRGFSFNCLHVLGGGFQPKIQVSKAYNLQLLIFQYVWSMSDKNNFFHRLTKFHRLASAEIANSASEDFLF